MEPRALFVASRILQNTTKINKILASTFRCSDPFVERLSALIEALTGRVAGKRRED
jgi:hypothetical protein